MSLILKRYGAGYAKQGSSPSVSLSVDVFTTVSGQNTAPEVVVTLHRNNHFKDVDLAVSGLPTGVTGSFSVSTLRRDTTTSVLTLTIAAGAPLGPGTFTITASGDDITDATITPNITVANPGGIITSGNAVQSVLQGSSKDIAVTLQRVGAFTGAIDLAVTGLPTGVTASFPNGASFTGSDVTKIVRLSAAVDAPLITGDAFVITSSGTDIDDWTVNGTVSVIDAVAPFFSDNFNNGARTNANGFEWVGGGANLSVSTEQAYEGTHSLRFNFVGKDPGLDSSVESRFNLGRDCGELWVEYWLRVPDNFTHRSGGSSNNKFFMLWANTYNGGGFLVSMEYEKDGIDSNRPRLTSSTIASRNEPDNPYYVGIVRSGDAVMNSPVMTEEEQGEWHQFRFHLRACSSLGAADGVWEGWKDGNLLFRSRSDWNYSSYLPLDDPNRVDGVQRGYLLGWANSGFLEDTVFFIDAIKFYDVDPEWGL